MFTAEELPGCDSILESGADERVIRLREQPTGSLRDLIAVFAVFTTYTAFVVAYIASGSAYQLCIFVIRTIFGTVDFNKRTIIFREFACQNLCSLCLTDTGWSGENKTTYRLARFSQTHTSTLNGFNNSVYCVILSDYVFFNTVS